MTKLFGDLSAMMVSIVDGFINKRDAEKHHEKNTAFLNRFEAPEPYKKLDLMQTHRAAFEEPVIGV